MYLMQFIIDGLCIKFNSTDAVGITSSTGVSALNIGGEFILSCPTILMRYQGKLYILGLESVGKRGLSKTWSRR